MTGLGLPSGAARTGQFDAGKVICAECRCARVKIGALIGRELSASFSILRSRPPFGRLLAWDPVHQKEVWRVRARVAVERRYADHPPVNLVFQGTADGRFVRLLTQQKEPSCGKSQPVPGVVWRAAATYMVDKPTIHLDCPVGLGRLVRPLLNRATEYQKPRERSIHSRSGGTGEAAGVRKISDRRSCCRA